MVDRLALAGFNDLAPLPWCAVHDGQMIDVALPGVYDECWYAIWTAEVGLCQLEDPPRHWVER